MAWAALKEQTALILCKLHHIHGLAADGPPDRTTTLLWGPFDLLAWLRSVIVHK